MQHLSILFITALVLLLVIFTGFYLAWKKEAPIPKPNLDPLFEKQVHLETAIDTAVDLVGSHAAYIATAQMQSAYHDLIQEINKRNRVKSPSNSTHMINAMLGNLTILRSNIPQTRINKEMTSDIELSILHLKKALQRLENPNPEVC